MKIIFLDIDGPITYGMSMGEAPRLILGDFSIPYPWVQEACDALTKIIEATDAKIVISSDWRHSYTLEQFGRMFDHYKIPNVIIDHTAFYKVKLSSPIEMDRGHQIIRWVNENKDKVESWVALDDLQIGSFFHEVSGEHPHIKRECHIRLDGEIDLPEFRITDNVDRIINHLNNP